MGGAIKLKQPKSAVPALVVKGKVPDWSDVVLKSAKQKNLTLRQCYDALLKEQGKIARTALALDVNLIEFGRLVEATPVLFEIVYLYRELLLDNCENVVAQAVNEDPFLALEVLKRLGKRRGYGDRDNQAPSKIQIEFVKDWRGDRSLPEAANVIDGEIVEENGSPAKLAEDALLGDPPDF